MNAITTAGRAEGIRQGRVKALRDMAEWHDGQARKWQNKRKRGSANGQYCGALRDEHKWSAAHFRAEAAKLEKNDA